MSLLHLVILLVVVGFGLWAINKYVPMEDTIKKILNIVIIGGVIAWLLFTFVCGGHASDVQVPTLK